jgi:hypothetical protein
VVSIAVMDSSTGARYHYFGGCNDCVSVGEGEQVYLERPVWVFGCACAPRFTGVLGLELAVPAAARIPVVNVVALVGR